MRRHLVAGFICAGLFVVAAVGTSTALDRPRVPRSPVAPPLSDAAQPSSARSAQALRAAPPGTTPPAAPAVIPAPVTVDPVPSPPSSASADAVTGAPGSASVAGPTRPPEAGTSGTGSGPTGTTGAPTTGATSGVPPTSPRIDLTRTLPPGSSLPSSAVCAAAVRRSSWEPRPQNATANRTTPPATWVQQPFEGFARPAQQQIVPRVNGDFTGTTDEILQWGACKWGFDVDTVRAQAAVESKWLMSWNGDGGASLGILQIKVSQHPGTWPWARDSTAYNVDYVLARRRACYEGWTYDGSASRGDLWGCIGMWYSGGYGSGYGDYVAAVRQAYAAKPWQEW